MDDGQCDWPKTKGHQRKHASQQYCKKCWLARWPADWGIPNASAKPSAPPPPPGLTPQPPNNHSPLIDALRRIAQLENQNKELVDHVKLLKDHVKDLEYKVEDKEKVNHVKFLELENKVEELNIFVHADQE